MTTPLDNIPANGGIIGPDNGTSTGVKVTTFTESGNFTQSPTNSPAAIDYLVVAGGGKFVSSSSGIHTASNVGIGTTQFTTDMVGAGNSFQGMYISNGMTIYDNELNGNHYISTNFNGLMAGPVTVNGALTIDGNYVVV